MIYLSIDIETTGLDPKIHSIIELAAILDNNSEVLAEKLPYLRLLIPSRSGDYNVSAKCLEMHKFLWPKLNLGREALISEQSHIETKPLGPYEIMYSDCDVDDLSTRACYPDRIVDSLMWWLQKEQNIKEKLTIAGKNYALFDRLFIPGIDRLPAHRRILDPGPMYVTINDREVPSMQECLNRANLIQTKGHTAYGDALDVVNLIRAKLNY